MPTKIEWTNETWNPVTGCSMVSPGCAHCYAERLAKRFRGRFGYPADDPFRVKVHPERFDQPLLWRKPRMVFVCSMGDLFHESVDDITIAKVFGRMQSAPHHTYQVLTKRAARMEKWVEWFSGEWLEAGAYEREYRHVWLGVTAENQAAADERIPHLLRTPAAVRFVSVEPMLGAVEFTSVEGPEGDRLGDSLVALGGYDTPTGIDWVICGGESGPGARPMHPDWARSLRDQCGAANVPFFFKQWGDNPHPDAFSEPVGMANAKCHLPHGGRLLDGTEHNGFPEDEK